MTDQQTLFGYRIAEAEETLADARALLESSGEPPISPIVLVANNEAESDVWNI